MNFLISQHFPNGIIVGKADYGYRKVQLYPVIKFVPAGEVERKGAVMGNCDAALLKKVGHEPVAVYIQIACEQIGLLVNTAVGGADLDIIKGALIQKTRGPSGQGRDCQKEENGSRKGEADQRHGMGSGGQSGDDLSEKEQILSAVCVSRILILPSAEKGTGQVDDSTDQIDQSRQQKQKVLVCTGVGTQGGGTEGELIAHTDGRHACKKAGVYKRK